MGFWVCIYPRCASKRDGVLLKKFRFDKSMLPKLGIECFERYSNHEKSLTKLD